MKPEPTRVQCDVGRVELGFIVRLDDHIGIAQYQDRRPVHAIRIDPPVMRLDRPGDRTGGPGGLKSLGLSCADRNVFRSDLQWHIPGLPLK